MDVDLEPAEDYSDWNDPRYPNFSPWKFIKAAVGLQLAGTYALSKLSNLIICQARLPKISVNVSLTVFQTSPTEEFLLKLRNLLQDLLIQNVTRERKLTSNLEEKSIFYVLSLS